MIEPGTGLAILAITPIVKRVLGPTIDYFGEELKELTKKRIKNLKRIFINADKKLGDRASQPGRVPPKILKGIMEEGSFCEDELSAEYFGGVLASSRSEINRDDRGAAFIALLSRLSTYQIRSHYIFYEVTKQLFDGENFNIGDYLIRKEMDIYIPAADYEIAMEFSDNEKDIDIPVHVLAGLDRELLIGEGFRVGPADPLDIFFMDTKEPGIVFKPSVLGVELFLWAHGKGNLTIDKFLDSRIQFHQEIDIPIPKNAMRKKYKSTKKESD